MLFAEDGSGDNPDELDFFECRFNLAFRSFWIDFMRRQQAEAKQMEESPLENESGDLSRTMNGFPVSPLRFKRPLCNCPAFSGHELLNAIEVPSA